MADALTGMVHALGNGHDSALYFRTADEGGRRGSWHVARSRFDPGRLETIRVLIAPRDRFPDADYDGWY